MTAQVAADLRAAAEVLRRDGWTQNTYYRESGCHCVLGAIAHGISPQVHTVEGLYGIDRDAWLRSLAATDALDAALGAHNYDGVDGWNDTPGRTADEVIAALEAAADAAKAEQ